LAKDVVVSIDGKNICEVMRKSVTILRMLSAFKNLLDFFGLRSNTQTYQNKKGCPVIYDLEKYHFKILPNGEMILSHPAFSGKTGIVLFYIKRCINCQDTLTDWSAIGVPSQPNFPISQLNLEKLPYVRNIIGINGDYPSIKVVLSNGMLANYTGSTTFEEMDRFLRQDCGNFKRQRYHTYNKFPTIFF
jgi:hypothetical protein